MLPKQGPNRTGGCGAGDVPCAARCWGPRQIVRFVPPFQGCLLAAVRAFDPRFGVGVKHSRCQEVFTHLCKKPFSGSVCLVSSVSKNQRQRHSCTATNKTERPLKRAQ